MKELFSKTMVVCAAIGSFSGGAYVLGQGADSISISKVKAVIAADLAMQAPVAAAPVINGN